MKYLTTWVRAGWQKDRKDKILGKGEKVVGEDPAFVDRDELSELIQKTCNQFDAEGYEIISIFPTLRGYAKYDSKTKVGRDNPIIPETTYAWGYGWGYGFSVTDGAIITARRRA